MPDSHAIARAIAPALLAIAAVFLVAGASLATLPLHLHRDLGYGAAVVGTVAGTQFFVALLCRLWSGRLVDRIGPKQVTCIGLVISGASGLAYIASLGATPTAALALIFAGRAAMGAGEALVITAGQTWCLAILGTDRSAAAIGWAGTALFVALAIGGPLGSAVFAETGFAGISVATLTLPLLALPAILVRTPTRPAAPSITASWRTLSSVALPGLIMCLAGFCYSAMTNFSPLLALDRGWSATWAPLTAFSLGLVAMRVVFSTIPDRLGGIRTAYLSLAAMTLSLAALITAGTPIAGLFASFASGAAYAFIYPALGRVAVRSLSTLGAGSVIAAYSAFNDLALAVTNPLLGLVADRAGITAVYAVAAVASLAGILLTRRLATRSARAN